MAGPPVYDAKVTLAFGVRDRKASTAWYATDLGFELLYDAPEIGWCEMTTSVPAVGIGFSDLEEPTPEGPVPTFGGRDLDAVRARLVAGGVRFESDP